MNRIIGVESCWAVCLARVVERVEHGEITLAGNAERGIDAVDFQRIDENLRRGSGGDGSCHRGVRL
jgi:hypothetical protein